ncbi:uncharacterized protein LOC133928599 isoform X2 [Phragmites australis]|uniref:uncharacterized protein LOC133928599 isoform X2 n=1 Tax=Phragmites australis TaxID=29695 RepID=UPI002D770D33|nr:uncharacterized protein LOC133928599 isoform X2 [Phragmites australis]
MDAARSLPIQDVTARLNKLFSFSAPECDIMPYSLENPRPDSSTKDTSFRARSLIPMALLSLMLPIRGRDQPMRRLRGLFDQRDHPPLKRKRRSPRVLKERPAYLPNCLLEQLPLSMTQPKSFLGDVWSILAIATQGTIIRDGSTREVTDVLALPDPRVTPPVALLAKPRTKKMTTKRLSTEAQTKATSVSTSHPWLTPQVDSASDPTSQIKDPTSSMPKEDLQLKGKETSISIPTNDTWVAIKVFSKSQVPR